MRRRKKRKLHRWDVISVLLLSEYRGKQEGLKHIPDSHVLIDMLTGSSFLAKTFLQAFHKSWRVRMSYLGIRL
jgi:hypothetical protein